MLECGSGFQRKFFLWTFADEKRNIKIEYSISVFILAILLLIGIIGIIQSARCVLASCLLLRSHQASQQTNFGRVRDQPGFPVPDARLGCMYITAICLDFK